MTVSIALTGSSICNEKAEGGGRKRETEKRGDREGEGND